MQKNRNILITGGAGFIGSHLVCHFVRKYPQDHFYNVDALTYASDLAHLKAIAGEKNYTFIKADLNNFKAVCELFKRYGFDAVLHLAAESHVDTSIENPFIFAKTNIMGTLHLLEACKRYWKNVSGKKFYHVSTDEVFGSLDNEGFFTENSNYRPNSPYAASKASSDHFVRVYGKTYDLPYVMSNCSNNYGAHQHAEKLIPLCIKNLIHKKPLPLYGDGSNVRDWLFVKDHIEAIDLIFHKGEIGQTYHIGGNNTLSNMVLMNMLCDAVDKKLQRPNGTGRALIKKVTDRKGHDFRYAIDARKIKEQLGWMAKTPFDKGLDETIDWYLKKWT